jgi:membrane dipeptidase
MRTKGRAGAALLLAFQAAPAFAAAASPVDAAVAAALQAQAEAITLDAHLDTAMHIARPRWDILERHTRDRDISQVDYPRMLEGHLDGGFWAIYTPQGERTSEGNARARDHALRVAGRLREMVARNHAQFALATTADDAALIKASGRRVVYLSIENGYPLGQDPTLLRTFYELGVRLFGPVHFRNNDLGDSSTDAAGAEWHGLSPLGKQLVSEANRLGIVLDASHASDDVLDQMLDLSTAPIMLSHSGCKAVYDHPRNVDDARLRRLAAAGGVIHMNSLSAYLVPSEVPPARAQELTALNRKYGAIGALSPEQAAELVAARADIDRRYPVRVATLGDFMAHLLHALKVVGPDHVGIGLDWDGGGGVVGLQDVADLPRITERLLAAGYTRADVAKIWGGNTLRVLREVERRRQP